MNKRSLPGSAKAEIQSDMITLSRPRLCFCLSPELDSTERRRDMEEMDKAFREENIPYCVDMFTEERLKESLSAGSDSTIRKQDLFLTDSAVLYRILIQSGEKAVGYLHAGSREQDFNGAEYLIEEPQEVDPDSYLKVWQRLSGIPWTIAATRRLFIREITENDTDELYRLYDDPEARRFLPALPADRNEERNILRAYAEKVYAFYGYGMWVLCDRKTREIIGRAGLEPHRSGGRIAELGYLIRADHRHQGLCREALKAIIRFAYQELGFEAVAIRTEKENKASAAVAHSLGFRESAFPPEEKNGAGFAYSAIDGTPAGKLRYFVRINDQPGSG